MSLKYETGIATLIQFITISLLNVINGVGSIVTDCSRNGADCVWNTFATFVYILLIVSWFGGLWVLGYATQDRRSRRLAQLLILGETAVVVISLFNAKHGHGTFNRIISLTDLALALYVAALAFRLMRAKGGRVVSSTRARRRRNRPTADL